jgi:hypothetical protein
VTKTASDSGEENLRSTTDRFPTSEDTTLAMSMNRTLGDDEAVALISKNDVEPNVRIAKCEPEWRGKH